MTKEDMKRALQPIARGLFGKQGTNRYQRPVFTPYPLETMLADLTAIPPLEWYPYVFSREPLNGKFSDEQRRKWMEKAWECGEEYAEKIAAEFGTENPVLLANAMKMKVEYPTLPEKTDRVLFAEFREPDNIRIYMDAVKKADKLLTDDRIREILTDKLNVSKLLLAHELFHYVEEKYKKEIYTQQEKIRLWSLGPVHNDSTIYALGEIAAMGFAAKLNDLPYAPWVLDVFLVYGYSENEAYGLYDEIMTFAGREPGSSGQDAGESLEDKAAEIPEEPAAGPAEEK